MINRRAFLLFSSGLAFASDDFWKSSKASEWSSKDVQRLLTHSPWAKEVTLDMHTGSSGDMGGASRGRGGRGGGGMNAGGGGGADGQMGSEGGSMAGGGGRGGRGGSGGMSGEGGGRESRPEIKAIVRWESARP